MTRQSPRPIESLESRILMAETASAVLNLASTTGSSSAPVYNYTITLTNTGTTPLGTLWFSWVPGEDFLPTVPLAETSPAGWGNAAGNSSTPAVTGAGNSNDGSAIQWVAQSTGAALAAGQSLSGFAFSSHDSPTALAGMSPSHSSEPVLTSFVYQGAPETDAGFQFTVTNNASVTTAPTPTASLTPTITKSTLPAKIIAGNSSKGAVTVSLANQATTTTTGTATVAIYATTDGTSDSSATLLAMTMHHVKIAVGKSAPVTVPIKSTPTNLAAGSYTLVARVTDPLANSADSAAGPAVSVAAPFVSLSESFTRLTLPSAVVAGASAHSSATLSIDNAGNIATSGSTTVEFLLSATGTVGDGTEIHSFSKSLKIQANKTKTQSFPLMMIPPVAAGSYFVVAEVTDSLHDVTTAVSSQPITVTAAVAAANSGANTGANSAPTGGTIPY